jgi:L-alanine-DL-glutamate epimerase-like enolase superfamily enzyme
VCLKLGRSGGVTGLLDAAQRARRAGYEVYLASTLDGPLGIAAALHVAAAITPDRPCGLATLGLFDRDVPALEVSGGALSAPSEPGLGGGLLDWYD